MVYPATGRILMYDDPIAIVNEWRDMAAIHAGLIGAMCLGAAGVWVDLANVLAADDGDEED
jgi:hypothetical protein